jgi:parallel beta-helix repeat protein
MFRAKTNNSRIINNTFLYSTLASNIVGIEFNGLLAGTNSTILDNIFTQVGFALNINATRDITIFNNTFSLANGGLSFINTSNINFTNNTLRDGLGTLIKFESVTFSNISKNTLYNISGGVGNAAAVFFNLSGNINVEYNNITNLSSMFLYSKDSYKINFINNTLFQTSTSSKTLILDNTTVSQLINNTFRSIFTTLQIFNSTKINFSLNSIPNTTINFFNYNLLEVNDSTSISFDYNNISFIGASNALYFFNSTILNITNNNLYNFSKGSIQNGIQIINGTYINLTNNYIFNLTFVNSTVLIINNSNNTIFNLNNFNGTAAFTSLSYFNLSKTALNVSGRLCNSTVLFSPPSGGSSIITTNPQRISADGLLNVDVACADFSGAGATDNTTVFVPDETGTTYNSCADISTALGGASCYGFVNNYFIATSATTNYTVNNSLPNTSITILNATGFEANPFFSFSDTTVIQKYGVILNNLCNDTYQNNVFNSLSILDLDRISGCNALLFYNNTFGSINWSLSNMTIKNSLGIGINLFLQQNLVGLADSSEFSNLNTSANIQIRNVSYPNLPFLYKNGVKCTQVVGAPEICNITYDSALQIVYANVSSFSNYTSQEAVSCQTLTSSKTLNQNLTTASYCFVFNTSNLVFDCANYNITQTVPLTQAAMKVNNTISNVTIKNCNLFSFSNGLELQNPLSVNFSFNSIWNSNKAIYSENSSNNYFSYNNLTNFSAEGIQLTIGSHNNTLIYNNLTTVSSGGIVIVNSKNNTVKNNIISYAALGINLQSNTNLTQVINNTAFNNTVGFNLISGSFDNILQNNTAFNNSIGFNLIFSNQNLLENNTAYLNYKAGFNLSFADNNTLHNLTVYNNTQGIYLRDSNNVSITTAILTNNTANHFYLINSTLNLSGAIIISRSLLTALDFNITLGSYLYDSGISNIATDFGNYILNNATNVTVKALALSSTAATTSTCANSLVTCSLITTSSNLINLTNITGAGYLNLTMFFDTSSAGSDSQMVNISRYNNGWESVGQSFISLSTGKISYGSINNFSTFGVVKFVSSAVAATATSAATIADEGGNGLVSSSFEKYTNTITTKANEITHVVSNFKDGGLIDIAFITYQDIRGQVSMDYYLDQLKIPEDSRDHITALSNLIVSKGGKNLGVFKLDMGDAIKNYLVSSVKIKFTRPLAIVDLSAAEINDNYNVVIYHDSSEETVKRIPSKITFDERNIIVELEVPHFSYFLIALEPKINSLSDEYSKDLLQEEANNQIKDYKLKNRWIYALGVFTIMGALSIIFLARKLYKHHKDLKNNNF